MLEVTVAKKTGLNNQNGRKGIIEAITSPLGFYVLALLIVESFLGVLYVNNTDFSIRIACLIIGTVLFIGVVWVVTYLVIKCPRDLTFGGKEHLLSKGKSYGQKGKEIRKRDISRMPPTTTLVTKVDNL